MSAKILIIGDSPSQKLLEFALTNEFEIVCCSDEEERNRLGEELRITERVLVPVEQPQVERELHFVNPVEYIIEDTRYEPHIEKNCSAFFQPKRTKKKKYKRR